MTCSCFSVSIEFLDSNYKDVSIRSLLNSFFCCYWLIACRLHVTDLDIAPSCQSKKRLNNCFLQLFISWISMMIIMYLMIKTDTFSILFRDFTVKWSSSLRVKLYYWWRERGGGAVWNTKIVLTMQMLNKIIVSRKLIRTFDPYNCHPQNLSLQTWN